jgi:hypothetical protein
MNTFDKWRQDYDTMSLEQQVEFHNEIARQYPEQAHYDYSSVSEIIDMFKPNHIFFPLKCYFLF